MGRVAPVFHLPWVSYAYHMARAAYILNEDAFIDYQVGAHHRVDIFVSGKETKLLVEVARARK